MFSTSQTIKTYTIEKVNVDESAIIDSISKCIGIDEREISVDYDNWDFNTDDIELSSYFSGMIIIFIKEKISDEAKVKLQEWLDTDIKNDTAVHDCELTESNYPKEYPMIHIWFKYPFNKEWAE